MTFDTVEEMLRQLVRYILSFIFHIPFPLFNFSSWLSEDTYSGIYRPKVCTKHNKCVKRITIHLAEKHKGDSSSKYITDPVITFIPKDTGPTLDEYDSANDPDECVDDKVLCQ